MSRFAERGLLGLIVLLSLALNLATLDDKHSWGDDWAQYVAQARGIAEGDVAREVTASRFRNEHSSRPFGPTVAMWGFPLLIAPVYAIAGLDLFALSPSKRSSGIPSAPLRACSWWPCLRSIPT
jgi:hypothetical protein